MKKRFLLLLLIITSVAYAQDERKTLFGIIYDQKGPLANAHIVNFTTSQATFSNEKGEYRLFAKPKDSIRYTSIGYKSIYEILTEKDFNTYRKRTTLEKQNYELDEVALIQKQLSGVLTSDLSKVKKNKLENTVAKATNFSNVEVSYEINDDFIDKNVKPNVVQTIPNTFEGAGFSTNLGSKKLQQIKQLRKDLNFQENLPSQLLNELGEEFFFVELKIPVENYYHFLEFTNPLGIENLYKNNEVLKVINILRKEHKNYLKLIKKE